MQKPDLSYFNGRLAHYLARGITRSVQKPHPDHLNGLLAHYLTSGITHWLFHHRYLIESRLIPGEGGNRMGWYILTQVITILISIARIGRMSEQEKDLEILILRQQLAILQRKQEKSVKTNRTEKMLLAILTAKLKTVTRWSAGRLRSILRIVQPETVLGWHRDLVRRKWSYAHRNKGGRPKMAMELESLILRLARENPRW